MFMLRCLVGIRVKGVEILFWKHCKSPFTQLLCSTNHVILRFVQMLAFGFLIMQ